MSRSGPAAVSYLRIHNYRSREGQCLIRCRLVLDVPAKYPSAASAFYHTKHRHGGTPPIGVPVWWTGGSRGYGHVAISAGGGMCWSTDIRRLGQFDLVSIAGLTRAWGLHYQGWTEDINDKIVYHPPKPVIDLSDMAWCARHEPGTTGHRFTSQTTRLAQALHEHGYLRRANVNGHWSGPKVHAYSLLQKDYRKIDSHVPVTGVPDLVSLRWLGSKNGFAVNL